MHHSTGDDTKKVVYRRPLPHACNAVLRAIGSVLAFVLHAAWQTVRVVICALLVLIEPLLRITLVPLAFLSFVITLIFGFLIGSPTFPRWGMLAFSVGLMLVYWLFLGLMGLFMHLPPDYDRYR